MGYSNGYIASIILKNQPLREFKYEGRRTVKVPFGSEYVLRLKNKSKGPALVEVMIDGTDVLNGSQLILKEGETIDLERFVDDSSKGKKFKYISLEQGAASGEIDDPYRDENGLVRVTFHRAYKFPDLSSITPTYQTLGTGIYTKGSPSYSIGETIFGGRIDNNCRGLVSNGSSVNTIFMSSTSCSADTALVNDLPYASDLPQDKGATVEGSVSSQGFSSVSGYHKMEEKPTVVDVYMVGPNYVEPVEAEWGIYLDSTKEPFATFKKKELAFDFASNANFGKKAVTIKEV